MNIKWLWDIEIKSILEKNNVLLNIVHAAQK